MNSRGAMEGKYERVFFHLISFFTFPELIEKSTTATALTHRTEIEMWKTSEERENEWGGKKSFRQVKMRSIFHLTFCSPRITWLQVPFQSIRMERERTSGPQRRKKNYRQSIAFSSVSNNFLLLQLLLLLLSFRLHVVRFCHFVQFYWKHNTFNRILAKDKLLVCCIGSSS